MPVIARGICETIFKSLKPVPARAATSRACAFMDQMLRIVLISNQGPLRTCKIIVSPDFITFSGVTVAINTTDSELAANAAPSTPSVTMITQYIDDDGRRFLAELCLSCMKAVTGVGSFSARFTSSIVNLELFGSHDFDYARFVTTKEPAGQILGLLSARGFYGRDHKAIFTQCIRITLSHLAVKFKGDDSALQSCSNSDVRAKKR
eukprot:6184931-Pleurochrysis_carterae.AAC.3